MKEIFDELNIDDRFTISEDDIEFWEETEFQYLTEYKDENWSCGDDYIIACMTQDDKLFFVYVDYHILILFAYTELSHFEHEDYMLNLVSDLYINYNVTLDAINDFTSNNFITCSDGSLINKESNFEVENFDLIWKSDFIDRCGGGYNRIFYNEDTKEILVYSNKNGYEGLCADLDDAFLRMYDSEWANEVLEIEEDEYLKLSFIGLTIGKIDNEYKIFVGVPLYDAYNPQEIVMDIETKECYIAETIYREEQIEVVEDITFNALYVGSASGETYWIKKEIVEQELGDDYNMEDVISHDWGDDKEWTDAGFMSDGSQEDYVICGIDLDFTDICKTEDLV